MAFTSLQLLLDPDLYKRAAAKAAQEARTLDQVVVSWIQAWLGDEPAPAASSLPASTPEPAPATTAPVTQWYTVKSGDSLWTIAQRFYGDGNQYTVIAEANGLNEMRRIYAGMQLAIPSLEPPTESVPAPMPTPLPSSPSPAAQPPSIPGRLPEPPPSVPDYQEPPAEPSPLPEEPAPTPKEPEVDRNAPLPRPGVTPKPGYPVVPDGLEQIQKIFGKFTYKDLGGSPPGRIQIDTKWLTANIVTTQVPALGTMQCHRLLVPVFTAALQQLLDEDLATGLRYWGCFVPRHKGWDSTQDLSVHAWGIALDLNADTNAVGTKGTLDPRVIRIFAEHGFYWGGNFGDPMHFQYCISY